MEAEQLADEVGDDYFVGLLYAELGRIYRLYYDYPKSLEGSPKLLDTHTIFIILRHLLNIPNLSLPKHFIPNR